MKLTAKIVAMFFVAAAILVSVGGYLSRQREVSLFREEMAQRHSEVALAWAPRLRRLLSITSPENLQIQAEAVDGRQSVSVRWVRLQAGNVATRPLAGNSERLLGLQPGEIRSFPLTAETGPEIYVSYYFPVDIRSIGWALELAEPFDRRDAYMAGTFQNTLWTLAGLGAVGVLIAGLVGVRLVGQPLDALVKKTEQAAAGNLGDPLSISGGDELSDLAKALNRMCEALQQSQQDTLSEHEQRLDAVEQLRHADRLKTIGRLGAGIAHELGTPLNVVSGRASMIADGRLADKDIKTSAEAIKTEALRMTQLIQGLLDFARPAATARSSCRLSELVTQTLAILQPLAKNNGARLQFADVKIDDQCLVDRRQIQQVVSNLVMNAIHSKSDGATVNLDVQSSDNAGKLVLVVEDDGDGIAKENLSQVFEPFFTTRDTGDGTGLGLSIVHGIVTELGGTIELESEPGKGTRFIVRLPVNGSS